VLTFTVRGVFIGVNGTPTDLDTLVWRQVVVRRPSHLVDRPGGLASTDSGISSSCRCLATKVWSEPPQTLADQPRSCAGRPAPRPTRSRVWLTWSTCQIHPRGDNDFDIWSTLLCHHLKCSNLVSKFLKSSKH
jgi:hypothetical protein